MSKIALYGGAFNPPTIAHEMVVNKVIECGLFDKVYVTPTYKHITKRKKEAVDFNLRIEMCYRAFNNPMVEISTVEKDLSDAGSNGGTANLYEHLMKKYPNDEFYFIIGMDNATKLDRWYRSEWVRENMKFIVLPRDNGKIDLNHWSINEHNMLLNIDQMNVSSTMVRNLIQQKSNEFGELVSDGIKSLIEMEKLYVK